MSSLANAHAFDEEADPGTPMQPATTQQVDHKSPEGIRGALADPIFRFVGLGFASLFGILALAAFLTF